MVVIMEHSPPCNLSCNFSAVLIRVSTRERSPNEQYKITSKPLFCMRTFTALAQLKAT